MKIDPRELDRWIEKEPWEDPYWEGVYDEGWGAFEDGKGETDVPYCKGTEEYDTWLDGFKDAKRSGK